MADTCPRTKNRGRTSYAFIGGIGMDALGKDNALAAQHYLLLQAEAMGLGSCIMGYAQAAPKIVARHLDVPRFFTTYGVVALGHPALRFRRPALRKAADVRWVGGATQDAPTEGSHAHASSSAQRAA